MKFSALVFVAGLIASVAAIPDTASQSSTAPAPTATSSYPPEVQKCLGICLPEDTTCRAKCLNNPAPTEQQAKDTNDCAAKCPQGKGSQEDTKKYSDCVQSCISQFYLPTSTSGSGGSGATGTGSAGATGTGAYTSKSTSTSTSTAKSGAVSGPIVGTSFAGLMAIFVAVIAL